MKEILLDLAEVTAGERPEIDEQLVDFGVVGPGPRRALNFVNNRRWFDNEYDRSPQVFWGSREPEGRALVHGSSFARLQPGREAVRGRAARLPQLPAEPHVHRRVEGVESPRCAVRTLRSQQGTRSLVRHGEGCTKKKATSQYIFFLRYESGSLYKPSTRDLEVSLQPVSAPDAARMGSIWNYWEGESDEEGAPVPDDLHPDHAPAA